MAQLHLLGVAHQRRVGKQPGDLGIVGDVPVELVEDRGQPLRDQRLEGFQISTGFVVDLQEGQAGGERVGRHGSALIKEDDNREN